MESVDIQSSLASLQIGKANQHAVAVHPLPSTIKPLAPKTDDDAELKANRNTAYAHPSLGAKRTNSSCSTASTSSFSTSSSVEGDFFRQHPLVSTTKFADRKHASRSLVGYSTLVSPSSAARSKMTSDSLKEKGVDVSKDVADTCSAANRFPTSLPLDSCVAEREVTACGVSSNDLPLMVNESRKGVELEVVDFSSLPGFNDLDSEDPSTDFLLEGAEEEFDYAEYDAK